MELTLFIRTADTAVHEVELGGHDTVKDLYRKAGEAAGVEVGTFLLHFEGEELDDTFGGNEIQLLGMEQGCELLLCFKEELRNTMCVSVSELSSEETRKAMGRRLEEDPDLLLQVEASGVGSLELHSNSLPSGLRHLRVTDPGQCVTSIGDSFLFGCGSLVTLDLTSLQSVVSIGNSFLWNCKSLKAVDLTPFCNATSIADYFLYGFGNIKEVDLGPLRNVTVVGNFFMSECRSIETLDLSPLRNVRSIGSDFLSRCTALVSLDFRQLDCVESVGEGFLLCCISLTTVNLAHIRKRTVVGAGFMEGCDRVPVSDRRLARKGRCCVLC